MIRLSCVTVGRRMSAFHDEELSIEEQVSLQAHLRECQACAAEAASYRAIGEALRAGATATQGPPAFLDGLAQAVVSRMKAEQEESLPGRVNRMFEDLHLVWAALGATGSALACIALIVGIFSFAVSRERPDSIAGLLTAMASPGSDLNPVRLDGRMVLPRAYPDDVFPAIIGDEDSELTLAAVLRRDGRIANLELLQGDRRGRAPRSAAAERQDMVNLLDAISTARFEPARAGGAPVAVNMIWMLTHLTVRPKAPGETQLLRLSPRISVSVSYHLANGAAA